MLQQILYQESSKIKSSTDLVNKITNGLIKSSKTIIHDS